MKTDIYNQNGEKENTFDLPKFFSTKWSPDLVHEAVLAYETNKRQGSAHTKERGDVRGGGKKPWRQKGTGRARHGSIRSPIWKGGGVTFGPRKERNYSKKINKKAKRKALFSVLSKKFEDGEVKIINSLSVENKKTKEVASFLNNFFENEKISVLLIPSSENKSIHSAASNIAGVNAISPLSLNVVDLLKFKYVFIEKKAVEEIVEHYKL